MIRIAHMGHVNAPMMLGALGVIEMGLIALDIPHGSGGTQKAMNILGKMSKRDHPIHSHHPHKLRFPTKNIYS